MMGGGMKGGKGGMRNDHLVLKKMMITRGPYKGYEGIVKEATDTVARVELHSKMKIVPVNVTDLKDVDSAGRANFGAGGGFGMGQDMRPPATPSYAPSTPSHADNIMATPSRDVNMTPGRWDEAWNPNASGQTPGGNTPGFTPDGSGYGNTPGFTPDGQSPYPGQPTPNTPGEGGTPAGYNPGTPGGGGFTPGYGQGTTPQGSGYTPGAPLTPGGSNATPGDVATPGGYDGYGDGNDVGEWLQYATNAEVSVTGGAHSGATGVVTAALKAGSSTITLTIDGAQEDVNIADVQRLAPGKKDMVVVVSGQLAGENGILIGIDGEDGIVKMDINSDIKILDLESLCKKA